MFKFPNFYAEKLAVKVAGYQKLNKVLLYSLEKNRILDKLITFHYYPEMEILAVVLMQ